MPTQRQPEPEEAAKRARAVLALGLVALEREGVPSPEELDYLAGLKPDRITADGPRGHPA